MLFYLAPFCPPSEFHIIVAIDVLDYVDANNEAGNDDNVVVVDDVDDDDDDYDGYCADNDVDNINDADIFWWTMMIRYPDTAKKDTFP